MMYLYLFKNRITGEKKQFPCEYVELPISVLESEESEDEALVAKVSRENDKAFRQMKQDLAKSGWYKV